MAKGIIGKKVGMTQVFDAEGGQISVTLIEAGPCVVTQKKTADKDGYNSVQLGWGGVKEKRLNKALKGHFEKSKAEPKKILREFRDFEGEVSEGDAVTVEMFSDAGKVKITGTSKGKGFQGVIKRHGHHGGRATHGSRFHRAPGSIGACADPAKVFKGTKLPGHKGSQTVSLRNVKIHSVDTEKNLIAVVGPVPGPRNSTLVIEVQ